MHRRKLIDIFRKYNVHIGRLQETQLNQSLKLTIKGRANLRKDGKNGTGSGFIQCRAADYAWHGGTCCPNRFASAGPRSELLAIREVLTICMTDSPAMDASEGLVILLDSKSA
ncbi:hypothetical protein TNCV_4085241 [Trichonephila clavipes]|nr:hypothetical protein TNCV_4085241 [Trichonephila clavipes]